MSRPSPLMRSASLLGSWTLVSRVLGYLRDSLNAGLFGAGAVADAYFVAFRIPNLLRDLVGEGALSAAVVPAVARRSAPEARRLLQALLSWVAVGGAVVVGLGALAAPTIVGALAPGFAASPAKLALTVSLTRWLFPFIACISLAAAVQGWLTARERFGPQAFAPVALNVCVIVGGAVICPLLGGPPERRIYGWTAGVLLGGLAQWLVQVPEARRLGFRFAWRARHAGLAEVGALMIPAVVGLSVTQLHLLVNTILASLLPEGSVARLYYGNRLMQLPLGVVGVSLATAAYPAVARAFASGRAARAAGPLNGALGLSAFAVLPASAGLIALAPHINGLLFRYGAFTAADAEITAGVSSAYAIGILGHAWVRVLTPAFYAAGRPMQPAWIAAAGVVANALLSAVLMLRLGVVGLPLSTSLVTLASATWMVVRLRVFVPDLGRGLGSRLARALAAAVVMGGAVWWVAERTDGALAAAGWALKAREAAVTAGGVAAGAGLYALLAAAFRLPEWHEARGLWARRQGGGRP